MWTVTLVASILLVCAVTAFAADVNTVKITVDAARTQRELRPIWRFFGADEPNYAYMKDGQQLLRELGELRPEQVYFRTHNLLSTGDGTPALKWGSTNAYTEDADGKPIYDWTIIDRIFDTYRERHIKPYVQVGFMPEALSTHPQPYQHHWSPGVKGATIVGGWAYPPKDYEKWHELVRQWVRHCAERYGKAEVESWYWETWNEANILYWQGTPQEFYKLHDTTIDAVRAELPTARVGGPDSAGGGQWLRDFLQHCIDAKTPIDFVSFHAKGSPQFVDNHVRMGIANQLRTIDENFGIVASFPQLKDKPIIIGESDPDGCAACSARFSPQNGYRNDTLYASYTAAVFTRTLDLAEKHDVNLEGALTWAFEFEDQPYFDGFRALATSGVDLPVLNVFRMFSKMSGKRVALESSGEIALPAMLKNGVREQADVSGLASIDDHKLCVMLWHYHDDDLPAADAQIELSLKSLPQDKPLSVGQYRIDATHSNAYSLWRATGSPQTPTPQQEVQLRQAGHLQKLEEDRKVSSSGTSLDLSIILPRQSVSLLVIEWD